MKPRQRGYSLVEVLIAMAITSVVLLTVITLFYMGRRNVYSGKQMTVAAATGTQILEDMSTMTAQDLQTNFNLTDAATLGTVTLQGVADASNGQLSFTGSIARDSSACTVAATTPFAITCTNDPNGYMAKWLRTLIPQATTGSLMTNPLIGMVFTPRSPTDNTKLVSTAQFIRARIYVSWEEGKNHRRYAFFDTTKVNRQ
ncbi:MAG TPA: prepilin-type N-terminal cleavage/methylation domain-containing protein [Thermoanaerobaculia bacterium]|jgi:prepilin-type N-terminal cleavage/methylation domain-containing protein|nr:prepilin-type N-terminal cleavage/methylation domain-containing protein [Thermoanaerobaculia bacterium]